jgi:hypothetical protein
MITLILLIALQGTDGQVVWVNPSQVISIREPRGISQGHWAQGTKCLVLTVDGKFFTTVESCEQVRVKLGGTSGRSPGND